MKSSIIASLLILLGVGSAGAEQFNQETYVPVCWEKSPGNPYYHPCAQDVLIEKGYIEQRHIAWLERAQDVAKDPCLAKMEAAMKAMEPFLVKPWPPDYGDYEQKVINPRHRDALSKWDDTKRECWKEK